MRVGFIQFSPLFGEKKKNFKKVMNLVEDLNADLIVLPELFNTGYLFLNKQELVELAESPGKGETHDFILQLCNKKNCGIIYGFAEKCGDNFYNSVIFMAPEGIIGHYRKTHLFFEEWFFFTPGDLPYNIFEYKGVKIGMLICFDYIYPEAMRTLALKGAQIVTLSANLVLQFCPDAMVTRSIENRIFTILADRTGIEERGGKMLKFIGKSQIVGPDGEILVRVGEKECGIVVDINPELALDKRVTPHNDIFAQRRPELYFH
jgi:predicted amidohydrolase|uniref:CN hydrolase domain-containing protein n=1 Tax=candidate division WOR-3 bacterium TaxID=2052148 RepID=A0A7V3RI05_UNCW3